MATIARVRFVWSGNPIVGGGVSTFYTSNLSPATFTTAVRAFLLSTNGFWPVGVTCTPPSGGDLIDDATGALNGAWSMTPGAVLSGSTAVNFAAGVGARIVWNTGGVTRGRRVRGTTFLVPLKQTAYGPDGTLDDTFVSNVLTGAQTLVAADSGSMRIWTRPTSAGAGNGASHAVLSASVPDKVTWLRSRRT